MIRTKLLEKLKLVAPALADKAFVPQLQNFCFDGKNLTAFNDAIAIQVPYETPFVGAVNGKNMMALLKASRAKEYDCAVSATNNLVLKAGRSKLTFAMAGPDEFLFAMPTKHGEHGISVGASFFTGIKQLLLSVSSDTTRPALMGIQLNLNADDGTTMLYASDSTSIAEYNLTGEVSGSKSVTELLPVEFCENIVRLATALKPKSAILYAQKDHLVCVFDGETTLFARTVALEAQLDFNSQLSPIDRSELIKIPKAFPQAIKRACVILGNMDDKTSELQITGDRLILKTEGTVTQAYDKIKVRGEVAEVSVSLKTPSIEKVIDLCSEIAITDKYALLAKGRYFTVITHAG